MVEVERLITATPARVWELVSDVENWDRMLPTVQRITRVGGSGAVGVGGRFEIRQPGLPKMVYEITEWTPGSGFSWTASSPGVRTTGDHRVVAADGQTRLTLSITWTGPLAGIIGVLYGAKTRRMITQEPASFARLAEEQ